MPVLANAAAAPILPTEHDVPEVVDGVAPSPVNGVRPADSDRAYLSIAQAATELGVSQKTLQRAIHGIGRPLPHHRIGRRVVVARADLDRWVAAQRVIPTVAAGVSGDVATLLQRLHTTRPQPDQRRRG